MAERNVAIQGEPGSFSDMAARLMVGEKIRPIVSDSFEAVFDAVESGRADTAVIPIENSLIGSIHRNYDLLLERSLLVGAETHLPINHRLLAKESVTLRRVKEVYSHPVALDQCRNFFKQNPQIKAIPYYDTAGAAKMVAQSERKDIAAIAGKLAASLYDLKTLRKAVEDERGNLTRFLRLSRTPASQQRRMKTSIVFAFGNKPGALFKALSVFALRDLDLTKIESRPVRKKAWQYYFYVDFLGSVKQVETQNALAHLSEIADFVKVLGSYPTIKPSN
jgi:prephenate dehydratase